jgi:16S rRNA (guanine527-N7)-methyltransferase
MSAEEVQKFGTYVKILLDWQRITRLVGRADPRWIVDELLVDSLLFSYFLPGPTARVLDFGSGAGVPGLPLRIVAPRLSVTLLESRRKRASFLSNALRALDLANDVRLVAGRAEDVLAHAPELRGGFDVVMSRCSGPIERVVPLMKPFVSGGGRIVISGPPSPAAIHADLVPEGAPRWTTVDHPTKHRPRSFLVVCST